MGSFKKTLLILLVVIQNSKTSYLSLRSWLFYKKIDSFLCNERYISFVKR